MVYRYGLVLTGGQIATAEQIDTMISSAVVTAEKYYPAFQLVIYDNQSPISAILAIADEMREIRTICYCGKKATMVIRQDENGNVIKDGAQIQIGGNETYISLCRRHWREAIGD